MCIDAKMVAARCTRLRTLIHISKQVTQGGEELGTSAYGAVLFLLNECEETVNGFEAELHALCSDGSANETEGEG